MNAQQKQTMNELKNNQALTAAINALPELRETAATLKAEVEEVQAEILPSLQIKITDKPFASLRDFTIITEPQYVYLAHDDEEGKVQEYYRLTDAKLRELGIKPPEMKIDYCPALVAESAVVDAENTIIRELAGPLNFSIGMVYGERRKQLLELTEKFFGALNQ